MNIKNAMIGWVSVLFLIFPFGFLGAQELGVQPPAPLTLYPKSTPMPDFEFSNLHGGTLNSADMKGRVILIRFWATW